MKKHFLPRFMMQLKLNTWDHSRMKNWMNKVHSHIISKSFTITPSIIHYLTNTIRMKCYSKIWCFKKFWRQKKKLQSQYDLNDYVEKWRLRMQMKEKYHKINWRKYKNCLKKKKKTKNDWKIKRTKKIYTTKIPFKIKLHSENYKTAKIQTHLWYKIK